MRSPGLTRFIVPLKDETNEPFEVGIKAMGLLRELDQDLVDCHGNMEDVSGCTAAERCCGGAVFVCTAAERCCGGGGCFWMHCCCGGVEAVSGLLLNAAVVVEAVSGCTAAVVEAVQMRCCCTLL